MNTSPASAEERVVVLRMVSWLEHHGLPIGGRDIARLVDDCVAYGPSEKWYGSIRAGSRKFRAHRVAYVASRGLSLSDIDGVVIRHSCDNPPCVNPSHLVRGTQADNLRDMAERGRVRVARGEDRATKLSQSDIESIRSDSRSSRAIAREYGVDHSHIARIKKGSRW